MASTVVSARVNEELKSAANAYISEAGTTLGEVMKAVLTEIVRTKQVPLSEDERTRREAQRDKFNDFVNWRDSLPESQGIEEMTVEDLRNLIASRHA
jgi:addiction module RelB/DinJ family antitoxin